jgi:hypothetical protein
MVAEDPFGRARGERLGRERRVRPSERVREGGVVGDEEPVHYSLSGLVRAPFTTGVVTLVAFIAGMKLGGDGIELIGLYTFALLVNFSAVLFGTGVAMRLRTFQAAPLMQVSVFLTLFLPPVYVPLGLLAGWVHTAAQVNPDHGGPRGGARFPSR